MSSLEKNKILNFQYSPSVSIIIPTFNEEGDIKATLDACVNVNYREKEIIVVDDSTDNTPVIVREYAARGVRLIHRERNEGGRCGARNVGILAAKGEIVIILNADVLLSKDFIQRILPHYRNGAGSVLVESKVINTDKLIPRFINSVELYNHRPELGDWFGWSEGFSCLRKAALDIGLFPTPPLTLTAGEDGYFGDRLKEKGYKKIVDRSIVITHFAPYSLGIFWKISKERVSVFNSYFLEKKSLIRIFINAAVRTVIDVLKLILIIPILCNAFKFSRFSERGFRDFFPFAYAYIIRQIAFLVGKWSSLWKLSVYLMK